MWTQLAAGGLVSLFNFAIHAVMTGIIIVATRHTARITDHLDVFWRLVYPNGGPALAAPLF